MRKLLFPVLMLSAVLLAACVPIEGMPVPAPATTTAPPQAQVEAATAEVAATPVAEVEPVEGGVIPGDALMNATYSGIYDEPFTLTEGLYESKPVEGDPARPIVQFVEGAEVYGDLDKDGVEDAAVFLVERGGGSGAFTYVAAQLNRDGRPLDAGAVRIEDRIQVKSAAMEDGQVVLDIVTQGPGDVACCGSHKVRKTYALQEGRLVEIAGEGGALQRVSAADLDGTGWTLLELNQGQPALADAEVSLGFQDGRITGFGGCNSYTGSFGLGDVNPFVMTTGLVAATKKSCPEPIASQESAYITALERVSQWAYEYGRLGLYYKDDRGEPGRLLFAPQAAPGAAAARTPPATATAPADLQELMPPPTEELAMLRANPWQWVSFTSPVEAFEIENPAGYRLIFNTDATLAITADCNNVAGFYQGETGDSLTVIIRPVTLADCGPGSRSAQFIDLLPAGALYFFEGKNLYIDLMADGGTMVFAPADEAEGAGAG
jgi:heat shock protein HslJ